MSSARAKRRKEADRRKRIQIEKQLLAEGMPRARVTAILDHMRRVQMQERARQRGDVRPFAHILSGETETEDEFYERHAREFDDKGYEPTKPDSVLTGAARATGETATVVKRRKTITLHQYKQMQAQ